MSARDELARVIFDAPALIAWDNRNQWLIADAILAAGYTKPRTITTAHELDALAAGSVVIHHEGWGHTLAERHAGDGLWYVTGCLEYIRPEVLLPATVLYEPAP